MMKRSRILSLALALCLCLTLMPAASAVEQLSEMPDVFQGDGVYVTATEIPIPEGWSVYDGAPQGLHEGFIAVTRTENVQDEDSDGLFAYRGYLGADRNTYFAGWLNLDGEPIITLYSGDSSGYNWLAEDFEGLTFETTAFSDGYAVLEDHRSGGTYPSYIIIDSQGNEVFSLKPEAPVYISSVGTGGIHNGKFWVNYVDTTPGVSYDKEKFAELMDLEGNVLYRATSHAPIAVYGYFDNGVAVRRANNDALVIDIDDHTIVPRFTVDGAVFSSLTIEFNEDNQTLAALDYLNGNITYYVMEVHQGTYTGPGLVYDALTGTIRDNGAAPVDPEPEPAGDQPSSWAQEQVNAAVEAGLVPESLQFKYTQTATRAEFCALAVELYEKVTGSEITQRATFSDTTDVNVQKMAGIGVISGIGNNQFNPNGELTREQAATILVRLADALGRPLPEGAASFADNSSIASWALDSVGRAKAGGIMDGTGNNTFSPQGAYTREQSIMTAYRLFETMQ